MIISRKSDTGKFREFSRAMEEIMNKRPPVEKRLSPYGAYSKQNKYYCKTKIIDSKLCNGKFKKNLDVPEFVSLREAVSEFMLVDYKGKEDVEDVEDKVDE